MSTKTHRQANWQKFIRQHGTWIVLGLILALGAWFRLYQLSSLPPGLHPDEAANGLDVFRIFGGDVRPLYATNGPREALFFYFQAFFVHFLGNTILALRLAPAMFGTLAILFTYLWGRDWFGKRVGLFAAFFLAINPWVVIISRDGFRASMTPLMVAGVAYFAGRAVRTRHMSAYIGTGLFLGLGLYTYTAFQLMAAITVGLLIYIAIFRRHWLKGQGKNIAAGIVTFLLVLSPLVWYTATHADAAARAGGTSFLNKGLNNGKPLETLIDSTQKTLLQYNFVGDENPRHNVPGEPYLNTFVGIMFVLGILISLFSLKRSKYFAILAITLAMMLPAALTAEGLPHGLRSIGSAPGVMILAGIGLSYFLGRWYAIFPINSLARNIGLAFVVFLLLITMAQSYFAYFKSWAGNVKTYEAYSEDTVLISEAMIRDYSGPTAPKVYAVVDGYSNITMLYLMHNKDVRYDRLETDQVASTELTDKPVVFLIAENDKTDSLVETLKGKYPAGKITQRYSPAFPTTRKVYRIFEANR